MPEKLKEPSEHIYKSRKEIFIDNLIGGIAWGVGSIIGATVIAGLVGYFITKNLPAITSFFRLFLHNVAL